MPRRCARLVGSQQAAPKCKHCVELCSLNGAGHCNDYATLDLPRTLSGRSQVAFLDQAELGGGQVQYSVMARGRDMNDPAQLAALAAMGINDDDSDIIEVGHNDIFLIGVVKTIQDQLCGHTA